MTEGERLAQELFNRLTPNQIAILDRQPLSFVEGFLYGMFGDEHSMVALYNAAANWENVNG